MPQEREREGERERYHRLLEIYYNNRADRDKTVSVQVHWDYNVLQCPYDSMIVGIGRYFKPDACQGGYGESLW